MKDYHFQENDQDFGLTVRLDDINEKVKQLKKAEIDDELGDANAFLDAFESEKFDVPPAVFPEEEIREETMQPATVQPVRREPVGKQTESEEADGDAYDEEEKFSMSKKTMGLLAVLAVLACIIGFSVVRCGSHGGGMPVVSDGDALPVLVERVSDQKAEIYDILNETRRTMSLTEETKIIDEEGRSIAYGSMEIGDLMMVKLDGEKAVSIDYSAIETKEETDLEVNAKGLTLKNDKKTYDYGEKAMFVYEGEEISPKDLEPCDLLELKLVDDVVWSVEVLEYHGYIEVENTENIKNGEFRLDEEESLPLKEGMRVPVRAGQHTVTVTGSNIEERKDTVFVKAEEDFVYDLSKAQEKMGVIIVNANVSDYKLYINGALAESPAVLPMGEYDLVILKNGYSEWNQHVTLQEDTVTVQAELIRDIQYGTLTVMADVDGAWVYINGEEYGVAPMQVNLPYGSYNVQVEKDGYDTFRQKVTIQSSTASIHATLE